MAVLSAGVVVDSAVDPYVSETEAPATLAAVVDVYPGYEEDEVAGHVRDSYFTTIEISFGEDSGWFDATHDSRTKWIYSGPYGTSSPDAFHPEHMTQHTYTTPGEYVIRGRVTYWDGEVVYSDAKHLRVLPPGGAS